MIFVPPGIIRRRRNGEFGIWNVEFQRDGFADSWGSEFIQKTDEHGSKKMNTDHDIREHRWSSVVIGAICVLHELTSHVSTHPTLAAWSPERADEGFLIMWRA